MIRRTVFSPLFGVSVLILGVIFASPHVKAADWGATFIEGINSTDENGTIVFESSANLFYSPQNGQLPSKSVTDNGKSCFPSGVMNNSMKCKKSNNTLAEIPDEIIDFGQCESSSSDDRATEWDKKAIDIEAGEYGDVTLDGGPDRWVNFTTTDGVYKLKSLKASSGNLVLSSGQYWVGELVINNQVNIIYPTDGTVSFFIGEDFNIINKMVPDDPNELLIYGYKNVDVGNVDVNAYIVAENNLKVVGDVKGGIAANKEIYLVGGSSVTFTDQSEEIDVVPNCDTSPPQPLNFQFGKATSGTVTFEAPFEDGVTPIIFLMPTISTNNPDSNDGPASVFPANITNTGFSWSKTEPESRDNRYKESLPMSEVHWIAVTPGEHTLSDGTKLVAQVVNQNMAFGVNSNPYTDIPLDSALDVVLHQKQTSINNCWLTTTSEFDNSGARISMEASEVRSGTRCQPGNINTLQNERVGYLATESGTGTFNLDGDEITYQFGHDYQTLSGNLSAQCGRESVLTGFSNVPTLVAGKNSRRGPDGGWLRRCKLTNNRVSMVTDEDTYKDTDRNHTYEKYSFVALEKKEKILTCFNDDFSQGNLTDDWVVARSSGNFTPSIVAGRLRQTQKVSNQSTSTTYQRLFQAADNLVTIEFDHYAYGGSGADGIAVVLSDASMTPQPGAFGGPLGYGFKPGINGFAGGWLGVGIDEFGNFSGEGGSHNVGQRRQSVAVRGSGSGTSGYRYLKGACNNGTSNINGSCLSPKVDGNNGSPTHRYRITVDSRVSGKSVVEVQRKTGSGFVSIVPAFDAASETDQAVIPQDFILSLTGSTGGSNNIHEIDNIEICALESSPVGVVIDHFEFTHSGSALTCSPENVTIKACADASCSQLIPDQVTASLSPATIADGGGWSGSGVSGNQVTFSGGIAQIQLSKTTKGNVTLGVTGSNPGAKPFSQTLCRIGTSTPSTQNCTLTYADSGFVFGDLNTSPNNGIPDEFSNKPSLNILVNAVKKDDVTKQCIAGFANETKSVTFWSHYTDPNSGTKKVKVKSDTTEIDAGLSSTTAVPLNLTFNAQGQAIIDVNYADAGQMTLNARYTGSGDDAGLVMNGADTFVRYPKGLCVVPETTCTAGDASCPRYKKAGESFSFDVQAMAWESDNDTDLCNNLSTPNYAHNNIELSLNLKAPSDGVDAAVIADYNHTSSSNGINTLTRAVSEVGVFTITANPPSLYFGDDRPIESGTSDFIGRFYPNDFEVYEQSMIAACGTGSKAFNYMDEPVQLMMKIRARNLSGATTQNYYDDFASGTALLVGENNNAGVNYQSRFSGLTGLSWDKDDQGVQAVNSDIQFTRLINSNLDGPYASMAIGLLMSDSDGVLIASPDMNAGTTDNCSTLDSCNAKQITTQHYRHGRVVLENTYGPEVDILRMPVTAEYWDSARWAVNNLDMCTTVTEPELPVTGVEYTPALKGTQQVTRTNGIGTRFAQGRFELQWRSLIATPSRYRGQVTAPLGVPDWLTWYWNWDNDGALSDPRASAYFGTYRGHDRIIYWREVN
ncbi:MSHA biogenesis protein MshQ [Shewanella sp. GutCb]|uniref:DUF6701 domain-containing protein n=1 Tax=Shewanella sp. GutCb TaxID=2058315 RepID=UPI000C7B227C|nr:DUF6701 domain-containing protein [Shewanella sp. GutCb]PKG74940.1 MSHA biogenesis protein MshQ [Shewanella sp. GutCb]